MLHFNLSPLVHHHLPISSPRLIDFFRLSVSPFRIADKKTIGATQRGLIHVVFHEKGPEATRSVFTGIQMVVDFWLFHNGFGIGIGDTIAGPKVMSYITRRIGGKKQQVAEIVDDAYHDRLKPMPGMTIRESFETRSEVERELNHTCDDSGQYAQKNLKEDNNVSSRWSPPGRKVPTSTSHRRRSVWDSRAWKGAVYRSDSGTTPYHTLRRTTSALKQEGSWRIPT
jgi:hypothetical protein